MTTVLIADDHPLVRSGLRALLSSLAGIEVVGEAPDGAAAVEIGRWTHPDVVIMDLEMPGMDGIEAARQLARALPDAAVLVLTMHDDDESLFGALRAGAHGYVLKGAEQDDIARAIEAVSRGEVIFGPQVASRMVQFFLTGAGRDV